MDTTIVVIVAAVAVVVGLGLLGWKVPKVRLYTWGAAGVVAAFAVAVLQAVGVAKRGEASAAARRDIKAGRRTAAAGAAEAEETVNAAREAEKDAHAEAEAAQDASSRPGRVRI